MRRLLVRWTRNPRVRAAAEQNPAARELVGRFVAGQTRDELVPVLRSLTSKGLQVSVEYLGEPVRDLAQARVNQQSYLDLIARLSAEGLAHDAELSVRLGWLGQELGPQGRRHALTAVRQIARTASNAGAKVTIDMAGSELVDSVLEIWHQVRQDLPQTGITVQAALHRTEDDLAALTAPGVRVRLCKGGFREPREVAWRNRHEIDLAFVRCLRTLLASQAVALIATHDPRLVAISEELIRRTGRPVESYEFQMLYGVRPFEQRRLVDIGHTARAYVPFGPGWYDYYLERLSEQPTNAALFARSLLGKR